MNERQERDLSWLKQKQSRSDGEASRRALERKAALYERWTKGGPLSKEGMKFFLFFYVFYYCYYFDYLLSCDMYC